MTTASMVFVFGSNLRGAHGAAKHAFFFQGAVYGVGVGHRGNSYAIPTKDENIRSMPLKEIKGYVDEFIKYASEHPDLQFKVTQIGCGLAGYTAGDIAPMFLTAPDNCFFDGAWVSHLGPNRKYWGTV